MTNKQHRWLLAEIDKWVSENLIDVNLADQLRARYVLTDRGWAKIIFSAIGATLVGLGVILFFAYNWADMPKFAKLALVFAALIGSHGAAWWMARRDPSNWGLIEGLHIFGTMMFGAGIWLVAQIYHIDEHYPNALLVWGLGALGLAWSLPSLAQAFLAVLLITLWSGFEVIEFDATNHWAPLMIAAGIIPLAWSRRSKVLLFFALLAFFFVLVLAAAGVDDEMTISIAFYLGVIYILAGLLAPGTGFAESHRVFKFLGFSGYFIFLYVFSFAEGADVIDDIDLSTSVEIVYFTAILLLVLAGWIAVLAVRYIHLDWFWRWQWGLIAAPTLLVTAGALESVSLGWFIAIPINLVFLAHCVVFILHGCQEANAKLVTIACLLFSVLVITRYVDLFESLLLRGLIFLILGAGLFVVGNFYSRLRKRDEGGEHETHRHLIAHPLSGDGARLYGGQSRVHRSLR